MEFTLELTIRAEPPNKELACLEYLEKKKTKQNEEGKKNNHLSTSSRTGSIKLLQFFNEFFF